MEREYQSRREYDIEKEIEYQFGKAFSILKELGVDVPDYILPSDKRYS